MQTAEQTLSTEITCECGRLLKINIPGYFCPDHIGQCTCGKFYMLTLNQNVYDGNIEVKHQEITEELVGTLLETNKNIFCINLEGELK